MVDLMKCTHPVGVDLRHDVPYMLFMHLQVHGNVEAIFNAN